MSGFRYPIGTRYKCLNSNINKVLELLCTSGCCCWLVSCRRCWHSDCCCPCWRGWWIGLHWRWSVAIGGGRFGSIRRWRRWWRSRRAMSCRQMDWEICSWVTLAQWMRCHTSWNTTTQISGGERDQW